MTDLNKFAVIRGVDWFTVSSMPQIDGTFETYDQGMREANYQNCKLAIERGLLDQKMPGNYPLTYRQHYAMVFGFPPAPADRLVGWQWKTLDSWRTVDAAAVTDPEGYARAQAGAHGQVRAIYGASPQVGLGVLEEIKYLALTAGAPGHMPVPKALARMVGLCNRAGVTKKLDDLRPLFAAASEGSTE